MDNNRIDIAANHKLVSNIKYTNYSKQGSESGNNTKEIIINAIKKQANKNKESE